MKEFISVSNKTIMENAIKQCIIHYDNIAIKEPLRSFTEVTLKSLKENREIRQKLGPPSQGQMQSHCDL